MKLDFMNPSAKKQHDSLMKNVEQFQVKYKKN